MERIPDVAHRVVVRRPDIEEGWAAHRVTLRRARFGPVRAGLGKALGVDPRLELALDPLASEAWRLMDGRRTVAEIRTQLRRLHPDAEDLSARLGRLVGLLISRGFLILR